MKESMEFIKAQVTTYIKIMYFGIKNHDIKNVSLWLSLYPLYLMLMKMCLLLDNIFFMNYQKVVIKEPVFIIGHYRSGSTFLQRFLEKERSLRSMTLGDVLMPSILFHWLFKGLLNLSLKSLPGSMFNNEEGIGHKMGINLSEEEQSIFWFYLTGESPMLEISYMADSNKYHNRLHYEYNGYSGYETKKLIQFLKECYQRYLHRVGNGRILSKSPPFTCYMRTILDTFPDGKFIYLVRTPYEVIPSWLSLCKAQFIETFGESRIKKRMYKERYRQSVELYKYFEKVKDLNEFRHRIYYVNYDELMNNFEKVYTGILGFLGIKLTEDAEERIKEQGDKQRRYKRKHKVLDIEEFGLSNKDIRRDLEFVFERYGFTI